jgi:hypothetical protein
MPHTKQSKRKTAPAFAKVLRFLIEARPEKSQRGMANIAGVDAAAVHHLCTTGAGSEEVICRLLKTMKLKRRRILEILADRRAELCDGEASEMWRNFRYAFPNSREYMAELCPLPLDRACACSYAGISLRVLFELAKNKAHIEHIEDLSELKPWQIAGLFSALAHQYGAGKAKVVFSQKVAKDTPLVLYLDVFQQYNAAEYVPLRSCEGRLLCGIPHVVLASYMFGPTGEIEGHHHAGGVELLYSEEGTFELTYGGTPYPRHFSNDGSVIALDGAVHHSIRLVAGASGRLLVVRYDPRRRLLPPGPTLKEREKKKREKRQNPNKAEQSQTT